MTRTKNILVGVAVITVALAVGYTIFLRYAARQSGAALKELVLFTMNRMEEVTRPLTEADAILRYDHTDSRFTLRPTAKSDQTATLTETELPDYIRRAMPPKSKLVVFYHQADFPTPPERASFESRIRASLETGGAASVTFAVEQPSTAKSLFQ